MGNTLQVKQCSLSGYDRDSTKINRWGLKMILHPLKEMITLRMQEQLKVSPLTWVTLETSTSATLIRTWKTKQTWLWSYWFSRTRNCLEDCYQMFEGLNGPKVQVVLSLVYYISSIYYISSLMHLIPRQWSSRVLVTLVLIPVTFCLSF